MSALISWFLASGLVQQLTAVAGVALAIVLGIFGIKKSGEKQGRLKQEKETNDAIQVARRTAERVRSDVRADIISKPDSLRDNDGFRRD